MKKKWILFLAGLLLLIGIFWCLTNDNFIHIGKYTISYFASGQYAMGVFAAGNFAIGIFSIGIFSIGIFSVGIFNIGLYGIGIFLLAYKKKSINIKN